MTDLNFLTHLNAPDGQLGMLRAQGPDAAAFLQGQLSQDVLLMPAGQARLAAWCSAKGRMLASFWVYKISQEDFLLILSRDLLASTMQRMKMFVLRAKCQLSDVSALYRLDGLVGEAAQVNSNTTNLIADRALFIRTQGHIDTELTLVLSDGHMTQQRIARALRIQASAPGSACVATQPPSSDTPSIEIWNALEISSGVARLSAPVSDLFVPQMLNYESVGGVNFKKGCYPGQEVVARSQFRGTLKRRGFILSCQQAMQAGQEVFDARDDAQPCGILAQTAKHPAGGYTALASLQTAAADSPSLRLGSADGAALQIQSLPYTLLADV